MLNYSKTAKAFDVYDQKYDDFHVATDTSGDILAALADLEEAEVGLGVAFCADSEEVNNSMSDCIKTGKSVSGRSWLRKRVAEWKSSEASKPVQSWNDTVGHAKDYKENFDA